MNQKYTQDQVDELSRELIAQKLRRLIDAYDGSDQQAKDIVRGLVAARRMEMDIGQFGDALLKLSSHFDDA